MLKELIVKRADTLLPFYPFVIGSILVGIAVFRSADRIDPLWCFFPVVMLSVSRVSYSLKKEIAQLRKQLEDCCPKDERPGSVPKE
ncbi:hypothetical protein [Planctomicrobium sp. SH527]|uniref:hypothetical protein n=1 Tax=Planctomicrobium sp. SH527 TaxID=3448123 RepID=UPI003F5CAD8A